MNRILFSFFISIILLSCNDLGKYFGNIKSKNTQMDTVLYQNPTEISFRDTLLDLGTVNEDVKTPFVFQFTNIGKAPLLISDVRPGCGCTVAEYPKEPLMPGTTDSIQGYFNSKDREGPYEKHIDVQCNSTQKKHTLVFKVNVKPKK